MNPNISRFWAFHALAFGKARKPASLEFMVYLVDMPAGCNQLGADDAARASKRRESSTASLWVCMCAGS